MTKRGFSESFGKKVSEITGTPVSAKKALEITNAFYDTVREGLAADGKVQITGDQTFEVKDAAARVGKNPKTGVEIQIPARKVVKSKLGSNFKK